MQNQVLNRILSDNIRIAQEQGAIPAFAYARISSDVQDDGNSRENQEESARRYAENQGLYIVHIFNIIESAKNEGRKVFNQMLDLSQYFNVKHLLFKSSDRMSRNYPDVLRIQKLVDEEEYKIHFIQEHKIFTSESTHTDKMILNVETAVNRHWSEKISYDVKMANKFKVMKGVSPGRSSFGYIYNHELKQHEKDPAHQKTLQFIFDEFDTGKYSLNSFVELLNRKGIRTKTGRKWTKGNLYSLLSRIYYTGDFVYHGEIHKGIHEPYFSKQRYAKRLERLGSAFNGAILDNHKFPLSKFIQCGYCDRILTGDRKKGRYIYYKHECTARHNQPYIPESRVYDLLDAAVRQMRFSPTFTEKIKTLAKQIMEERSKDNKSGKVDVAERIEQIEQEKDKLLDLYMGADIDRSSVKRRMKQYNRKIELLNEKRSLLDTDYDQIMLGVMSMMDELRDKPLAFISGTYAEKSKILRKMAKGVVITDDNVRILWDEPYVFLLRNDVLEWRQQFEEGIKKAGTNKKLAPAEKLPRTDSNC